MFFAQNHASSIQQLIINSYYVYIFEKLEIVKLWCWY